MRIALSSLAVVLALLALPVQAQNKPGAVKLAWNFTKGAEFHFRRTLVTKQNIDMGAMGKAETTTKNSYHMKYECEDVTDKGVATIRVTYVRGQLESKDSNGKDLKYDSANPDDESKQSESECKIMMAYVGASFAFKVDGTGHVLEVKEYDAILERMSKAMGGAPAGEALSTMYGEEGLKRQLELSFHMLPEHEVAKGDTWSRTFEQPVPMIGTLHYDLKFTYKGMKTERGFNAAHIVCEAEPTLVLEERKEGEKDNGMKATIEEAKASGYTYFLPSASQFLKSEYKEHMAISVTGEGLTFKIVADVESAEQLMTAEDLKAEDAEIRALKEGKATKPPEEKKPEEKKSDEKKDEKEPDGKKDEGKEGAK